MTKITDKKKNYPTCPLCGKTFSFCLIVAGKDGQDYHPQCLELKKEKETNPLLFAKVERLEKEIREMKGARK
jgi:hypothetical protein